MRKEVLIVILLIVLVLTISNVKADCVNGITEGNNISQYGITWFFDKEYKCGQFVNGDYWVKTDDVSGVVNVTRVEPEPTMAHPYMHGSMVNPIPFPEQGYDDRVSNFDMSKRLLFPVGVYANSSIISTESWEDWTYENQDHDTYEGYSHSRSVTRRAQVLTVVDFIVPEDTFRPPYVGDYKPFYSVSQINTSLILNLSTSGLISIPNISKVERDFERLWLDHKSAWDGAYLHPTENMMNFGRDMGTKVSDAALLLLVNVSGKDTLLGRFLQLGIDNYGIARYNDERGPMEQTWLIGGGHANGRKWPIVFTGMVLGQNDMLAVRYHTNEDGNTYFGDEMYPLQNLWNGWQNSGHPYASNVMYGIHHLLPQELSGVSRDHENRHPSEWTEDCGVNNESDPNHYAYIGCDIQLNAGSDRRSEAYRHCCTSAVWVGEALAARLMDAEDEWLMGGIPENNGAFFAYVDRWMYEPDLTDEINANLNGTVNCSGETGNTFSEFVREMWAKYRAYSTGDPIISLNVEPNKGWPPLLVNFDASGSSDSDGYIADYYWEFGDGMNGNGEKISYTYQAEGVYYANLTITDNDGKKAMAYETIIVNDAVSPGLTLYLNFDNNIIDNSGEGHVVSMGYLGSYPLFVDGKLGQAVSFDGSGASGTGPYVKVGASLDLGEMDELTISFWAKKNVATSGNYIMYSGEKYTIYLYSGQIKPWLKTSTGEYSLTSSAQVQDTNWHHYAFTYDGSELVNYVDGNNIGSTPASGRVIPSTQDIYLGKNPFQNSFNGAIDDLRIYNRALTDMEINDLYTGITKQCTLTSARWEI